MALKKPNVRKMLTLIINKVLFCTEPVYGGSNAPAIFFLLPMVYRKFFVDKNISILVATTVIEVGVDVPSATVMIIEQAERFGLAQLHQLRGRIGRGSEKSICLLMYDYPLSDIAKKRLEVMRQTDNGFIIAEEDLKLRGSGEVLGTRQSGLENLKLSDFELQSELISIARQDALQIIQTDPSLKSPRGQALKNLMYLFEKDVYIQTILAG